MKSSKKKIILLLAGLLLLLTVAGVGIGTILSNLSKQDVTDIPSIEDVRKPEHTAVEEKEEESNHILDAAVLGLWSEWRLFRSQQIL